MPSPIPPPHRQAVFWIGLARDLVLAVGAISLVKLPVWVPIICGVLLVGLRYAYAWYSQSVPASPVGPPLPPPDLRTPQMTGSPR